MSLDAQQNHLREHQVCTPASLCEWHGHPWNREPDSTLGRAVAFVRRKRREELARAAASAAKVTRVETIRVPEHETKRLTVRASGGDWTFTFARTGCLRVQRGDFCAYVPVEALPALHEFLGS